MALATKCPHCNTVFRVAADQLKLRGGIVRCGACNEVFDGNAALVEPAAKPTPLIPEIVRSTPSPAAAVAANYIHGAPVDFDLDDLAAEAAAEAEAEAIDVEPVSEAEPEPLLDLDLDLNLEPEPEPKPAAAAEPELELEPESEPAPPAAEQEREESAQAVDHRGRIEPSFDTPQEHIVAVALDDLHHFDDLEAEAPTSEELHAAALEELHHLGEEASSAEPSLADEEFREEAGEEESGSVRDETALHAIAAVNIDARDDAESLHPTAEPMHHFVPGTRSEGTPSDTGSGEDSRDAAAELDHEELGFVRRANRSEKYGKTARLAMIAGSPLLVVALLLQAATTFRNTLAANYPALKPTLETTCSLLGCKIELPTQLDALSIEQGELQTVAENTFSFTTTLRNQSRTSQAWPHIELILNDSADKPVLRRVFAPRDYLSPAEAAKGFSARSEQTVKLYFELSQLKASGYHIAIFYP